MREKLKEKEVAAVEFKDIIYEKKEGIAKITINRPHRLNAFAALTLKEMVLALMDSGFDNSIGVVVLTGAGDRAFCTGGDQTTREAGGYASATATEAEAGAGVAESFGFKTIGFLETHSLVLYLIRAIPKPVIAQVNGYAIGGGHVLQMVCDITIAAEHARFGQVGPRVGSFDAGFGAAYMARIIGQKRARELWYLCRQYTAQEAFQMGLVNKVVPKEKLEEEVSNWCKEILQKSPTAISFLKASFNADTDHIFGLNFMAERGLELFYNTEESVEGRNAFIQKRPPDFSKFRK